MQTPSTSVARNLLLATLALAITVACFAEDERAPYVWDAPTLHLLWHDAYRIYPDLAVKAMAREVERLFAANGISVQVHAAKPGQSLTDFPEPRVSAVLHPVDAERWSLGRDVMAAAVGEPGRRRTIFVFYPDLIRTVGYSSHEPTPRDVVELARGTGRVVAHELVHVLVPERGHAAGGLMAEKLTRKILVKHDIALDSTSRNKARAAVEALPSHAKRVADVGADRAAN